MYEWSGTAWTQMGVDINGEAAADRSGYSVSLDSNRLAIGAVSNFGNGGNNSLSGHVRIYEWNGNAWIQLGVDIDGEAAADWSGYSVSLDSNKVAIGAIYNDGNGAISGHVRVYSLAGVTATGLLENNFAHALRVYPNPTEGDITIDLGARQATVALTLTDASGKQVGSATYTNAEKVAYTVLQPTGVYFMTLTAADQRAVIRLVKE